MADAHAGAILLVKKTSVNSQRSNLRATSFVLLIQIKCSQQRKEKMQIDLVRPLSFFIH